VYLRASSTVSLLRKREKAGCNCLTPCISDLNVVFGLGHSSHHINNLVFLLFYLLSLAVLLSKFLDSSVLRPFPIIHQISLSFRQSLQSLIFLKIYKIIFIRLYPIVISRLAMHPSILLM
jgi:hypothetical protein